MSWAQNSAVWEVWLLHRGVGCWRASRPAFESSRDHIIARYIHSCKRFFAARTPPPGEAFFRGRKQNGPGAFAPGPAVQILILPVASVYVTMPYLPSCLSFDQTQPYPSAQCRPPRTRPWALESAAVSK